MYLLPLILQGLLWVPAKFVLRTLGGLEVRGAENIPPRNPIIFAANHTSEFDIFLIPAAFPVELRLMPLYYTSRGPDYYAHMRFGFLYGDDGIRSGLINCQQQTEYAYGTVRHV